jgi:membrane-associated phospholipid phosphatase
MKRLISENPFFFAAFGLWLLLGGWWLLEHSAGEEIMFWSGHRSGFSDLLFKIFNHMGEGPAWVGLGLAGLFFRYRHTLVVALTGFTVLWVSFLSKSFFAHERPAAYLRRIGQLDQVNLVDGVDLHFGATSFPSGHTMSAFALFGLIALLIPYKRLPALGLFLIALLVAMARIYLVQHFLKDVYAGSIFGVAIAMAVYAIQRHYPQDVPAWYNRGLSGLIRPSA